MGPDADNTAPEVVVCFDYVVDSAVAAKGVLESSYAEDAEDVEDAGEDRVVDDAVDAEKDPAVDDENAVAVDEGDVENVMDVAAVKMNHHPGMERTFAVWMVVVSSKGNESKSNPVAAVAGLTNFVGALAWVRGGEGSMNMGQIP